MFDIWFHYSEFQEQEEENGELMNQTEYRSTIFEIQSISSLSPREKRGGGMRGNTPYFCFTNFPLAAIPLELMYL